MEFPDGHPRPLDVLLSPRRPLARAGGSAFCRSTKSAYIVSGVGAQERKYAIAKLAERFGGGKVGENASGEAAPGGGADALRGTVILPLGDLPRDHFEQIAAAEQVIDAVCVDRRKLAHWRPRDL